MPEVIATYLKKHDFSQCQKVLNDLILSFNDDFVKYKKRVPVSRLREVFQSVVAQTGGKFVYSKAAPNTNHRQIKEADFTSKYGRYYFPVTHSAANGIPLGAESNEKRRKFVILDTGIFIRILNLNMGKLLLDKEFKAINRDKSLSFSWD